MGSDGKVDAAWNQAHFGAWCVVSAPLILGLDLTETETVMEIIDTISNKEALAVNQDWAGHPGGLVYSGLAGAKGFPAARSCDTGNPSLRQRGWKLESVEDATGVSLLKAPGEGCLKVQGAGAVGGAGGTVVVECDAKDLAQQFTYDVKSLQLRQPSSKSRFSALDEYSFLGVLFFYFP